MSRRQLGRRIDVALVLIYGTALLIGVLVSGLAARTVLSTSLLFLATGALVGAGGLGWLPLTPDDPLASTLADLALFTVLFTDGQRAGLRELRAAWRLSRRALLFGMPLTMVGIALLAHLVAGLGWLTSLLVGAVLSPTDPVFAAVIVTRTDVPRGLRRLLNVKSGLNDGLALPVVLILLGSATSRAGVESEAATSPRQIAAELAGGTCAGDRTAGPGLRWATTACEAPAPSRKGSFTAHDAGGGAGVRACLARRQHRRRAPGRCTLGRCGGLSSRRCLPAQPGQARLPA